MVHLAGRAIETESLTRLHWLAILLVFVTGVIHIYAGVIESRIPVSLAGIGFLGAIAVFLFGYRRPLLYLVGVVYTAIQLSLWYVVKAGEYSTIGYVDKTVQIGLVLLLLYLYWNARRSGKAPNSAVA